MATTLDAALDAVAQGWAVLPLVPDKKTPLVPGGFKKASLDPNQIRKWWIKTPNANLGIATGGVSGIVVLDIDCKNGVNGEQSLLALLRGRKEPLTRLSSTASGGRHALFKLPKGVSVRCSAGKLGPGLDVRGDGGYIVAPPSRVEGVEYRWINDAPLALVPDWLLPSASGGPTNEDAGTPTHESLAVVGEALPFVNADDRETWLKCGWAIARMTHRSQEGFKLWLDWSRKSARHNPVEDPKAMEIEYFDRSRDQVSKPVTIGTVFHLARKGGWADSRRDGDHYRLATAFLDTLTAETGERTVFAMGSLWLVQDELWRPMEIEKVSALVGKMFGGGKHCKRGGDFAAVARLACNLAARERFFEDAAIGIATPTAFWRVTAEGKIVDEPLTPAHRQRMRLSVEPDKKRPPKKLLRMLSDAFAGHDAKGQIQLTQQLCGAAVARSLWRHRIVALLLGATSSGKSTLLSVLAKIFPQDQIGATSPQRWDSEYFVASLAGKALNIVGELDPKHPIPAGVFKTVTGRDQIEGRHPTHRPFTFVCEAAHFFNANKAPPTSDRDDAFFRRWRILYFAHSVKPGKERRDLDQEIVREELGAFIWWALQGAAMVERNREIVETKIHRRVIRQWRVENNSALAFVADGTACKLVRGDESIPAQEVFQAYLRWASENGVRPFGRNGFYEALGAAGAMGIRVVERGHQRYVLGLALNF